MTDERDDLDRDDDLLRDEDPRELKREIRRIGARAAYEALLEVATNRKAPAPSRATAGVAILRAAGFFERDDAADDTAPAQSIAELEEQIRRWQGVAAALDAQEQAEGRKAQAEAAAPEPASKPIGLFD
jgi:hypothetical protein